jgi:hypothetical protein
MGKTFRTGRFVLICVLICAASLFIGTSLLGQGWRAILPAGAVLSLIPAPARGIFEIVVESTPSFLLAAIACVLGGVFLRDNYMAYPVCAAVPALARVSLSTGSRGDTALLV